METKNVKGIRREREREISSDLQNIEEETNWDDNSDEERVREADDDDGAENGQQVVHKTTQNHWQSHLFNISFNLNN